MYNVPVTHSLAYLLTLLISFTTVLTRQYNMTQYCKPRRHTIKIYASATQNAFALTVTLTFKL